MKAVCEKTGMTYETLKFYCNQGLVPHVKRDAGNRRVFDERDVAWIESLGCVKRCGLSIQEMRHYVQLCLQGEASIPERKKILAQKRQALVEQIAQLQGAVAYVDQKQAFYEDVLAGKRPYVSNLLPQE
ncbi:MAG TPA: MerR family transcriptional regulator [Firmicutes bacterium]|nr:MerR family transcriptional regulator [Bacillota bacterium]